MEEEENSVVISGDVENIIIKLEPMEDFLDDEENSTQGVNLQINEIDEATEKSELPDNEISSDINESNIVQIPFYLESYFADNDNANTNNFPTETNQLTCSFCKITFPTEKLLYEHLIVHIDIHKMGCNVCDKDLNTAEKYQLHVMAITRQSIYFCDLCKKSCAGVVRSKDQTRPLGKAYVCHDCEIQVTGKACILGESLSNFQSKRKFPIHDPVFQSCNKKDGSLQIEIKLNGSTLNPDIFFHRCQLCDAFFAQSVTLTRHLRVRHNFTRANANSYQSFIPPVQETVINKFKCQDCDVAFSDEQELVKHTKHEHEIVKSPVKNEVESLEKESPMQNQFKCDQQDVSYSENFNLTKHLRQKRKRRKQKFTCKMCLKQFRLLRCYNSHVNFHLKIHNLEKKETVEKKKYKCVKKTLSDVSQKRNLRRTRLRNS